MIWLSEYILFFYRNYPTLSGHCFCFLCQQQAQHTNHRYIRKGLFAAAKTVNDLQRMESILQRSDVIGDINLTALSIKKAFSLHDFMGAKALYQRAQKTSSVIQAMLVGSAAKVKDVHDGFALLVDDLLDEAERAGYDLEPLYDAVIGAFHQTPQFKGYYIEKKNKKLAALRK